MTNQIEQLQKRIEELEKRNKRVEKDKAWEVSWTRKLSIICITYIIATCVMWSLGDGRFYLNALIPTIGYFLSTVSIPAIEKLRRKKK